MQTNEFILKIVPLAIIDMQRTGIPASLTISQAALESGWGKSGLTQRANNLFGIKGEGPAGSVLRLTTEYESNGSPYRITARFRAYHDWLESINDHSNLILHGTSDNPKRYHNVINADYKTACLNIAHDGYATDPNYAQWLINIIEQYELQSYDQSTKPTLVVSIELNGKKIANGFLTNNIVIVPVRIIAEALQATVILKGKKLIVNEQEITSYQLIKGSAFAPIKIVTAAAGGQVTGWNPSERKVIIAK